MNTKHVLSIRPATIRSLVVSSRATILTTWWSTHWTFVRIYRSRTDLSFDRIKPIISSPTHSVSNHVTNSKFLYMTIVSVHLHIFAELVETATDVLPHCTRFEKWIDRRRRDCARRPMKCNRIMVDLILRARVDFYWLLGREQMQ